MWRTTGVRIYTMSVTSEPLVSIVIPAYLTTAHEAELLVETLDTVTGQTQQNFETIVVDDGSRIDVAPITRPYAHTTTLRQENAGSAVARNTGIEASNGDYFLFLDADDHLLPGAIEAFLGECAEHPECGFVIGPREEMTYQGGPVQWSLPELPRETQLYLRLLSFDWYIIPPSSVMFRREVVEAIGPWRDPWGADDLDYYLRAARQFRAWCFHDPVVTRYRRYAASSSRDGERMLHSVRAVYERQWPLVEGDAIAEAAFRQGIDRLTQIFRNCLAENLQDFVRAENWPRAARCRNLLAHEHAKQRGVPHVLEQHRDGD